MECLEDNPDRFPPDPRPVVARESTGRAPSEKDISPEVGTSNPPTRLSNVLFPQPLGPINAQKSPFPTSIETRSSPVMRVATPLVNFRHLVESHHGDLLLHP